VEDQKQEREQTENTLLADQLYLLVIRKVKKEKRAVKELVGNNSIKLGN